MSNISEIPTHVGIILDGNRRWAKSKGLPSVEGHRQGYNNLKTIVDFAFNSGVKYVSAYIFSTENWKRTQKEVNYLMNLAYKMVTKDLDELHKKNIKLLWLGSKDRINDKLLKALKNAEEKTANNIGGTLGLCFNYGGQQEIVDSAKAVIESGEILTIGSIEQNLYAPDLPRVDLLIRTSGEKRISNFMLWRLAYAEMYFSDVLWPDFSNDDFGLALKDYANRKRRFGS
jgi:undecaprenyl diphosphate synthase